MSQLADIQQINSSIMHGTWSNTELESMISAIKYARARLTKENKRKFWPGDSVKFTSNRNGQTYTGTVEKVNRKYIVVRSANGLWRVPANMLEFA